MMVLEISTRDMREVKDGRVDVTLEADASDLGLPPGEFPAKIRFREVEAVLSQDKIVRKADGDIAFVQYHSPFTLFYARIYNT